MSTALATTNFDFNSDQLRTSIIDDQPWFLAADACRLLGLTNPTKALLALDPDEKTLRTVQGMRGPAANFISEAGLYKLIQGSRRPEARMFDRWVRHTVLPALRKDGMYVVGEEKVAVGEMDDDELMLLVVQRLEAKIARTKAERDALAPKAAVADRIASHDRTVQKVAASFYGVNMIAVLGTLYDLGYLYKHQGTKTYRVYSKHRDRLFGERMDEASGKAVITVMPDGYPLLERLYQDGKLPMRKGFQPKF